MKQCQLALGVAVFTLGILSLISSIGATEPLVVNANGNTIGEAFAPDAGVSLRLPLQNDESLSYGAVAQSPTGEPSASELNRQLTNPVSSIWSISNQSITSS